MSFKVYTSVDVLTGKLDSMPSPTGDGTEPVFSERINSRGEYEVYESERKCLQDEIDAALEDTLITNILRRVTNGEYDLLNQHFGRFADVTGMPVTVFELNKQLKQAYAYYNSLPDDVKSKFSDFDDFSAAVLSDFDRIKTAFAPDPAAASPAATDQVQQNAQNAQEE